MMLKWLTNVLGVKNFSKGEKPTRKIKIPISLILLRQLEKPESARLLLSERLLPINRLPEYVDALRECEAALGIEREKSQA